MKGKKKLEKLEALLAPMYKQAVEDADRTGALESGGRVSEGGSSSHYNGRIRGLAEAARAVESAFRVDLTIGRPEEEIRDMVIK